MVCYIVSSAFSLVANYQWLTASSLPCCHARPFVVERFFAHCTWLMWARSIPDAYRRYYSSQGHFFSGPAVPSLMAPLTEHNIFNISLASILTATAALFPTRVSIKPLLSIAKIKMWTADVQASYIRPPRVHITHQIIFPRLFSVSITNTANLLLVSPFLWLYQVHCPSRLRRSNSRNRRVLKNACGMIVLLSSCCSPANLNSSVSAAMNIMTLLLMGLFKWLRGYKRQPHYMHKFRLACLSGIALMHRYLLRSALLILIPWLLRVTYRQFKSKLVPLGPHASQLYPQALNDWSSVAAHVQITPVGV